SSTRYDVILVDLYGPGGPAESDEAFWTRCLDALAPGGCLANNWADFAVNPKVRPMSDALSAVARTRGLEPIYVTRRGFRDDLLSHAADLDERIEIDAGGDTHLLAEQHQLLGADVAGCLWLPGERATAEPADRRIELGYAHFEPGMRVGDRQPAGIVQVQGN